MVSEAPADLAVVGDRRQLVSALANLCDNAVKYSDPHSKVELRARGTGPWVEIEVIDLSVTGFRAQTGFTLWPGTTVWPVWATARAVSVP